MRSVWRVAALWRGRCATARTTSGALLLLLALSLAPTAALAQPTDSPPAAVSVVEPRAQLTLGPGAAAEGELRFTHDGPEPTSGQLSVVEYRLTLNGPRLDRPADGQTDGAARWVSLDPTSLLLRPGLPESVRYRVEVPPEAAAGDHSAVVLLETDGPGSRVGVRLTVSVPGEVRPEAELLAFGARRTPLRLLGGQVPSELPLFDGGPIHLRAQVENTGPVQFTPNGTVELLDLFGRPVASLDLPSESVFPGDVATLAVQWRSPPPLGLFTARLNLQAAEASTVAEERLLVVPWQQVLAALLFVLALRLLLGRRFSLPLPGRRSRAAEAPLPPHAVLRARVAQYAEAEAGYARQTVGAAAAPAPEPTVSAPAAPPMMTDPIGELADSRELLGRGQQAARAGDRLAAYRLFVQIVEREPEHEEAWLWRAGTAADPDEAVRCLQRVLEINPDNLRARRGLEDVQRRVDQRGAHENAPARA